MKFYPTRQLILDIDGGGGGPKSEQTTQTVSGSSKAVAGRRNIFVESGSIGVGEKGTYVESGGFNLPKSKNSTFIFNAAPPSASTPEYVIPNPNTSPAPTTAAPVGSAAQLAVTDGNTPGTATSSNIFTADFWKHFDWKNWGLPLLLGAAGLWYFFIRKR